MSYEAVNWALAQDVQHSTAKFVLVVMAHHADMDTWLAWPSVASLAASTSQDRKTVVANIARLRDAGLIVDTNKRVGDTKQIPVYLINSAKNGTASGEGSDETVVVKGTKFGTAKVAEQSQKRESSENGNSTVFPHNSTVFPLEQSRFSLETVPKTGHGKIKERSEPSKELKTTTASEKTEIPDWVPDKPWRAFLEMRVKIKKPMTEYAKTLALKELQTLVDSGQSAEAVINQSVMKSWQGFFPLKTAGNGTVSRHGGFGNQDYRAGVADDGSF